MTPGLQSESLHTGVVEGGSKALFVVTGLSYSIQKAYVSISILDDVNFSLSAGQILGIVGPNGSGKSTLFKLILGQIKATHGTIRFLRSDIKVGAIFQNVGENLVPWKTVAENVALAALRDGKNKSASNRIGDALSRLGILDFATRFPHELSGGQQQLAILARWLAFPPNLLLVDEAWSSLDIVQRPIFRKALRRLAEHDCGVAIVSHDLPELVDVADSIIVFTPRPGRPIARIECSDVAKKESVKTKLWKIVADTFAPSA